MANDLDIEDLNECSCFIEFIKRIRENRFYAASFINSILQEYEC